ncbi:hypothetical protein A3D05_00650 [Candidatus Gottesmanbacteria bacterium RIFCSPHIGHO2_02_FULL_40_24]|uniref:tRNA dimethylallyltransferase n=1 Tax=Candidatus Gottesmanbacteria bacterium RIFCSPHIGHO2_01_FULL_40_15 TaxID=1798376 RepID=A0A1F5Z6L6_9BACT|nr:MAG: hypothetical protein A2777_01340 [Candidatus Gottesmanbacteria bacterium RIFCSPHIGHO2_01_FULL_40_15]OGG18251.1 MAG: hypothetical protein A3D05_00650 [Candidatus Gottesmanbacteria bacterium RIFCSPHIGHO2_02_FULL_40_24]OGG23535.1 MAG: hypothetical protein A3E42_00730 [Candidatus Gottesmanbacteria bacterium RIFCSPHIGHO2_12_FULL_40_13]OGG31668.1 MAG: hypothetical protein A3I80_03130 [Candidatus Gottesmanbacteria bacterium RIFCSPLOWO2_02_FULL_40_10]
MAQKNKLLIIAGPTAVGKTALAVKLARRLNGELISADSRHVYRGLDIATGKDISPASFLVIENRRLNIKNNNFTVGYRKKMGIPVWLVDLTDPGFIFNPADFRRLAGLVITDIRKRSKIPIVVGGTGFYIKTLISPMESLDIPPDYKLRKKLEPVTVEKLSGILRQINPVRFKKMNQSDRHNKRRLIRAIETSGINYSTNAPVTSDDWMMLYLTASKKILHQLINLRVKKRLTEDVLSEIKKLMERRLDERLPALSAIPYPQFFKYLKKGKNLTPDQLKAIVQKWKIEEFNYAKRQLTWFNKMKKEFKNKVLEFDISEPDYDVKIVERADKWYTRN